MREELKIIAHRGYSGRYPENTLISFQKAIDNNAQYIELDVQYSKDEKIAVIHDFTLERTTNGKGNVSDFTLEELKKLSAGYLEKFGNKFINEKIPSLEEVIELSKDKVQLLIEIKRRDNFKNYNDDLEKKIIDIIKSFQIENDVMIVSFNLLSLGKIKNLEPDINIGCLFYKINENDISRAIDIDASFIIFNYRNYTSHALIEKAKLEGLSVGLYTIDEISDFERFRYSIDAIATNYIKEIIDHFFFFSANE